jgi:hypothetical protein
LGLKSNYPNEDNPWKEIIIAGEKIFHIQNMETWNSFINLLIPETDPFYSSSLCNMLWKQILS